MEWLGIYIPDNIKDDLKASTNPIVTSLELVKSFAKELTEYCLQHNIPFGFNIESVATRKDEIEASLELLNSVNCLLKEKGLRAPVGVADGLTDEKKAVA
jgi:hypothetical protein